MKKYKMKIVLNILSVFIILGLFLMNEYRENNVKMKSNTLFENDQIDYQKYDSLMIVAHPDDETIWGGNHLKNGNYLVVCITNGDNEIRRKEFNKVMDTLGTQGILLKYPDKTDGKKDDWKHSKKYIAEDIQYIIKQNKWKKIVTHNPDGEYAHPHHIMTNQIVTHLAKQDGYTDELYYFGKYIKKKQIPNYIEKEELSHALSVIELQDKIELTQLYSSQKKVMKKLEHMFPYENWISYHTWYNY